MYCMYCMYCMYTLMMITAATCLSLLMFTSDHQQSMTSFWHFRVCWLLIVIITQDSNSLGG
jgi:hypothetical protein